MTSRDTYDIEEYEKELSSELKKTRDRMMDVARWHAQLQVLFDRTLIREIANQQ